MSMLLKRGLWRQILLLRTCQTNPNFPPPQKRLIQPVLSTHSIPFSSSSSSAVEVENTASEEIDTARKLDNRVSSQSRIAQHLNEEGKEEKEGKAEECEKPFAFSSAVQTESNVSGEMKSGEKLESQGAEQAVTAHKLYEEGKAKKAESKENAEKIEKEEGWVAKSLEDEVKSLRTELEDQKSLIKSLMQDVNLLKSCPQGVKPIVSKVTLSEWEALLEHMKNCEFLKDERKGSSKTRLFDDPASVKRALYKFSQVHESIYESLPQNDIKLIAQNGRVDNDQKAQSSLKRLRKHYELDVQEEDNVSNLPSIQPKLSDVMRLLYSTITLSQPDVLTEDVKSSIVTLLKEIIRLSGPKKAKTKASDAENVKAALDKDKNISKSDTKSELWECPRCHFKNIDHKDRCVECSRKRPTKTYSAAKGDGDSNSATATIDEQLNVKLPQDGKMQKTDQKEGNNPSLSDQENTLDSDAEFLDDILDSDDSEEEKENGKKSSLSDLFNKRNASPRKKREDRSDRGRNSVPRSSARVKNNNDEDSDVPDSEDEPRTRRGGSKGFLDEESDEEDLRTPRSATRGGFGDDSSRRTDRWDRNSSRSSGMRGGGRDSYDDRRGGSGGGWRGGRRGGDRFGGGDRRDRDEDSYEDRGSRFGGGGGGRSRGRGRSTRY